ncbi:MAG TPA: AtpZ/AtpI family protein [Chthonomonadales bacterium]|nr:AtpZ/AtpI family protein [Chthonomonadales bacterium]
MPIASPIPDPKQRGKAGGGLQGLVQAEKIMQIAIVLPSAAFLGWLGGSWADSHFHQSWMGLAGFGFGSVAGMVHVIRFALAAEKKIPAEDASARGDGPGGGDKQG